MADTSAEIQSPPYPDYFSTSRQLYEYMCDLRRWVNSLADSLRPWLSSAVQATISQLPELPDEQVMESVSVVDKCMTLAGMQQLRADWDELLRHFEGDWDSRMALRGRHDFVLRTCAFLTSSLVLAEHRERAQHAVIDRMRKNAESWVKRVQEHLPEELREEAGGDADIPGSAPAAPDVRLLPDEDFFSSF
jgi:hypothetical protein